MISPNISDSHSERLRQQDIARRGQDIYERVLRSQVETTENIGKIISIDIDNGNYEVGDDILELSTRLQMKSPTATIWAERIGFNAVYAVGGTLTQVNSL